MARSERIFRKVNRNAYARWQVSFAVTSLARSPSIATTLSEAGST